MAAIVDGVTKLDRLEFDSKEAQQAATMRKMLVAMAKDVRVLLIKLADRLHNMRTIASLPEAKQKRIAQETLDIYAPLAHRLGIQDVKWQLEDLAFAVLHPKRYVEIEAMVLQAAARARGVTRTRCSSRSAPASISSRSRPRSPAGRSTTGRSTRRWSCAARSSTRSTTSSACASSSTRSRTATARWARSTRCGGRCRAASRTTSRCPSSTSTSRCTRRWSGPQGGAVEFQIRTDEMHRRAEYGVAAHWGYKEQRNPTEDLVWLQRIVDWQQDTDRPGEFMQSLKIDLEQDEVFVFTPKGDVVTLPTGATPVDFAYAIHTEVGHRCIGARVNGRLVPLDSALQSGDTCEIFTSKVEGAGPSRDWLQFVQTPRARSKIRQWFSRERRVDAIDDGRDELDQGAAPRGPAGPEAGLVGGDARKVAEQLNYADLEALLRRDRRRARLGQGRRAAGAARAARRRGAAAGHRAAPAACSRTRRDADVGVHVEGLDDVMVRLSRCCTPVPGDEIMGFVTRGRGVSVHRTDCANAVSLRSQADRVIDVEWDNDSPGNYVVSVEIEALDRSRLLRDVADVLSEHHVNILSCTSQTQADRDRAAAIRVRARRPRPPRLDPRWRSSESARSTRRARVLPAART